MSATHSGGRLGIVLAARPVGSPENGRQLVSPRLQAVDGRDADGVALLPEGGRPDVPDAASPNAPGPSAHRPARAAGNAHPLAARLEGDLSPSEKREVARLRQRDAQLRQEGQAHAGNPGNIAGPIDYAYWIGPEGGGMRSAERFPFAPSQ